MNKNNAGFPLKPSLKDVRPDVCDYIRYLELENRNLQRHVAQLQVTNLSISNKNDEMLKLLAKKEEEINKFKLFPKEIRIKSTRDIAEERKHIYNLKN